MKKIECLTEADERRMIEVRDEWIALGHSTHPIDRERAMTVLRSIYEQAGLDSSNLLAITVDSPLACCFATSMLNGDQVGEQVRAQVWEQVRAQVWDQVWDQVGAQVGDQRQVDVPSFLWGNHDLAWLSFYDFFQGRIDLDDRIQDWTDLARATHWIVPLQGAAIFSQRPTEIHVGDEGLHCKNGPALRYRDGFAVYAINGHRVPGWIIMKPDEITVEKIKAEKNAETRRIMRERYGDGRYLADTNARVIHVDSVPVDSVERSGDIQRALIEDDENDRYLVGSDGSTDRVYYMRVPPECETCEQASKALSNGMEESKCLMQS